jgi:hypothetical protein
MHSTLSRILCLFISLLFMDFLMANVNLVHSYLSKRKSQIRVSSILSSRFEVLSVVPQGSALRSLYFNVLINDVIEFTTLSVYFC